MKEHPILFSTLMVQALLAGRKTQTRRIVKPQPPASVDLIRKLGNTYVSSYPNGATKPFEYQTKCRWKSGDILYVRETWARVTHSSYRQSNDVLQMPLDGIDVAVFKAGWERSAPYWKPSIHMPKAAARIWLQIESVRVERVQDISEEDAVAEGVQEGVCDHATRLTCPSLTCKEQGCSGEGTYYRYPVDFEGEPAYSASESFESLWESINGRESWEANPWVWVVSFKVLSTTGRP